MAELLKRNLPRLNNLLIVLALALLAACSGGEQKTPVNGGFDSEVLGSVDGFVVLRKVPSPTEQLRGRTAKNDTFQLNEDQIVIVNHPYPEGYYELFFDGNKLPVYLIPGKRMSVDIDVKKPFEKQEYSGKLKPLNWYLFDRDMAIAKLKANAAAYYELPEQEFIDKIAEKRSSLDTLLVMLITNHPKASPKFLQSEALNNLYLAGTYLAAYPQIHDELTGTTGTYEKIYHALEGLNLNDTNAVDNWQYYEFIEAWLKAMAYRKYKTVTSEEALAYMFDLVKETFYVAELRDLALGLVLNQLAESEPDEKTALKWSNTILNEISDPQIKNHLSVAFQATRTTEENAPTDDH